MKKQTKDDLVHVKNGFAIAGGYLLLIVVGVFLIIGFQALLEPQTLQDGIFAGAHSRLRGALLFGAGTAIVYFTMSRWRKHLPGFLAYGVIGASIGLVGGHYGKTIIPRSQSLVCVAIIIAGVFAARNLADRELRPLDKAALVLCILSFTCGIAFDSLRVSQGHQSSFALFMFAIGMGTLFLLVAWAFDLMASKR
jgi:hypothetical protein